MCSVARLIFLQERSCTEMQTHFSPEDILTIYPRFWQILPRFHCQDPRKRNSPSTQNLPCDRDPKMVSRPLEECVMQKHACNIPHFQLPTIFKPVCSSYLGKSSFTSLFSFWSVDHWKMMQRHTHYQDFIPNTSPPLQSTSGWPGDRALCWYELFNNIFLWWRQKTIVLKNYI